MIEKRFILKENGVIDDTQLNILLDGGEDKEDMVDLLNEQDKIIQELKSYLLHMGYKPIHHDDGHISLEPIEIKKMEIKNGLLNEWIK